MASRWLVLVLTTLAQLQHGVWRFWPGRFDTFITIIIRPRDYAKGNARLDDTTHYANDTLCIVAAAAGWKESRLRVVHLQFHFHIRSFLRMGPVYGMSLLISLILGAQGINYCTLRSRGGYHLTR